MENIDKFNLIWSAICFAFIAILAFIFKDANVLWLLILWIIGIKYESEGEKTDEENKVL